MLGYTRKVLPRIDKYMNKKKLKRIPLTIRLKYEIHKLALSKKERGMSLSNFINDIVEEKLK